MTSLARTSPPSSAKNGTSQLSRLWKIDSKACWELDTCSDLGSNPRSRANAQDSYVRSVAGLAQFCQPSPDQIGIGDEEIKAYLLHLLWIKKLWRLAKFSRRRAREFIRCGFRQPASAEM